MSDGVPWGYGRYALYACQVCHTGRTLAYARIVPETAIPPHIRLVCRSCQCEQDARLLRIDLDFRPLHAGEALPLSAAPLALREVAG